MAQRQGRHSVSDLQPNAPVIIFEGVERRLLWDFGVIEKVQEIYGGHPFYALEAMFFEEQKDGVTYRFHMAKPVIDLLYLLLNNEVEREKYFDGKSSLKKYTREQVGMLVDRTNVAEYVNAVVKSWTESNGVSPDDDDDEGDSKNAVSA